jgi:hypothetical protein
MVSPLNDSARKRIVRCEVPALVSREAGYWQTATPEQRRREETTAAKRFIATSLAKSVDKYGARIKETTTHGRDSPERPTFPEVLEKTLEKTPRVLLVFLPTQVRSSDKSAL